MEICVMARGFTCNINVVGEIEFEEYVREQIKTLSGDVAPNGLLLDQVVARLCQLTDHEIKQLPKVIAQDLANLSMPLEKTRAILELFVGKSLMRILTIIHVDTPCVFHRETKFHKSPTQW